MSEATRIRVLIVDDHAVVRSGLRRVLEAEPDLEVVGEAGDARNAVFQTRATKPDVILMDVVMPGRTGIEAIPDVLHDAPEAKVLILSMQDDPRYVREAFDAGASGYVLKEAVDTDVVAAIRDVAGGGRYVHPALGARMVAADAAERKRAELDPSPTASATCYACSRSGTRTRRSRDSSTSRSGPPRPTARTSCRSSGSRPVRSSSATPSRRACSNRRPSDSDAASRRAATMPARQPGARPPLGSRAVSRSIPLRASSQETTEFEFHISPVSSSSRPRRAWARRARPRARVGRAPDRRSAAAGCRRPRRRPGSPRRASSGSRSGGGAAGAPSDFRRLLPRRRRAPGRARRGPAPARSRTCPPARRRRAPSGRDPRRAPLEAGDDGLEDAAVQPHGATPAPSGSQ